MCGILIVCAAVGVASSKLISHKLSQKIAAKQKAATKEAPLFFYNGIGATPAFAESKEIEFDTSRKFTIEVGYTKTRRSAEKIIDKLNLSGFPVFMTPVQLRSGKVAYKIRMGLFVDKENAVTATAVLRQRTKYKGKLIALN
ncbi:SPOR domain-containing protein [bacterium]|nr:SPOR domain-containing protein [bacterium]